MLQAFVDVSLFQQVLRLWLGGVAIGAVLLLLDFLVHGSPSFFWLVPWPPPISDIVAAIGQAFKARPLAATSLLAVPTGIVLGTLALIIRKLAS